MRAVLAHLYGYQTMNKFTSTAIGAVMGIVAFSLTAGSAHAVLFSADDPVFGVGSITGDDVNIHSSNHSSNHSLAIFRGRSLDETLLHLGSAAPAELMDALRGQRWKVLRRVLQLFQSSGKSEVFAAGLESDFPESRRVAVWLLGEDVANDKSIEQLKRSLEDRDPLVRSLAAKALEKIR